jgi:hypothetical protein
LDNKTYMSLWLCGLVFDNRHSAIIRYAVMVCWFLILGGSLCELLLIFINVKVIADLVLFFAVLIQLVGLLVSQTRNVTRLRSRFRVYEPLSIKAVSRCGFLFAVVMMLVSVPAVLIIFYQRAPWAYCATTCVNTYLGVILGGNVLFILVDADCANSILQKLIDEASREDSLSLYNVDNSAREIKSVIGRSFLSSNAIVLTALINVLIVFVFVVLNDVRDWSQYLVVFSFLGREIVAAVVCLYWVALVNEKYDAQVRKIGSQLAEECLRPRMVPDSPSIKSQELNSLLNILVSNPIQYPLVGMVLRRKDVMVRFGIWVFGVLLSVATKSE